MAEFAVTDWSQKDGDVFEKEIFHRHHPFADQIDVSDEGLADLLDQTPPDYIDVVTMGNDKTDNASWRTGDVRGVPGKDVIQAIKEGAGLGLSQTRAVYFPKDAGGHLSQ